jgi:hypothetical protein
MAAGNVRIPQANIKMTASVFTAGLPKMTAGYMLQYLIVTKKLM